MLTCCVQKKDDSLQHSSMMAGVSAGASVKSKKLQQRNAILRSTGFIEEPARVRGVGGTSTSCCGAPQPYAAFLAWYL